MDFLTKEELKQLYYKLLKKYEDSSEVNVLDDIFKEIDNSIELKKSQTKE